VVSELSADSFFVAANLKRKWKAEKATMTTEEELKVYTEFEGSITEIEANKSMVTWDDYNKGWNAGSDAAICTIRKYISAARNCNRVATFAKKSLVMADLNGYIGIPETLPEAQQMITWLLDEAQKSMVSQGLNRHALDQAVTMIQDARKALNAVEAPPVV
jgi:hypothetical protein